MPRRSSDFNRRHVFEMMMNDLQLLKNPDDPKLRLDLCLATFLQNLDTDQGGLPAQHWVARVVYAFAREYYSICMNRFRRAKPTARSHQRP